MVKYDKEKLIGSGTYGNVWLVRCHGSRNQLVMKEVNLSALNASERQKAMMEVTILSKCKHKNIIKYIDAVVDNSRKMLQIVMEYADGGDLYSAIIKQAGVPFKEHDVISWFIQICLALQYIHFQNILHRDLKTQNIFLTRNKVIKVGDFGIARVLREPKELATTGIGTPYYLSPEICERKPYNYKSDMWALGCVLFEMAALKHPFQANSIHQLIGLITHVRRRDLPKRCSSLLVELVDELLSKSPERRPSTDEILSKPALQPYLLEYWSLHGTEDSALSSSVKPKPNLRRHSISDASKVSRESSIKRRASIAAENARAAKIRVTTPSHEKAAIRAKPPFNPRPVKSPYKLSPLAKGIITSPSQKSTYRVFTPKVARLSDKSNEAKTSLPVVTLSESSGAVNATRLLKARNINASIFLTVNDEPDHGYQSEETFKRNRTGSKCSKSPSKHSIVSSSVSREVFTKSLVQRDLPIEPKQKETKFPFPNQCHHSDQCQQCMLDMLWRNRIRSPLRASVNREQRTKFEKKLQSVFGHELFKMLYDSLALQWEASELGPSENSIQNIIGSLNYNQVQNLPLMMQLIQLDILKE